MVFWFNNLSEDTRKSILETCKTAVLEERRSTITNTTKDDIVRLLHLNRYPDAMVHRSDTKNVLTRAQLDARNSVIDDARVRSESWECLANIFNDYVHFRIGW